MIVLITPFPDHYIFLMTKQEMTYIPEPAFTEAFKVANKMEMIVCGLGTLQSIDSIPAWHDYKKRLFKGVSLNQIAGMAFGRPYDINGNFLIHPNNDKTLSIPLNKNS